MSDWQSELLKDPYNFQNIARAFRIRNDQFRHTRFEFFSSHSRLLEIFQHDGEKFSVPFPKSHPLIIGIAELEGLKIQKFFGIRYVDETNTQHIFLRGHEFDVPKCFALMLISPEIGIGDRSVDPTAVNCINSTQSLIFSLFGRQNVTDHIGTLYVDSQTGFMVSESPGFTNITIFERTEIGSHQEYEEIAGRLNKQIGDTKNRIRLAFDLFSRATFERDKQIRFIYYWISLEALSNSQNQGVIDALAKAYGISRAQIVAYTHVETIYETRLALFHHGIFEDLHPRIERSLSCIFIDILRSQIGLPCLQHAKKYFEWQATIADDPAIS